MNEKPRFVVNSSIDKEAKECEFKIEDSWADYGATVTFYLPYPYIKSQLDKKVEESKIALRKDYIDAQYENKSMKRFFTIGALVIALIGIVIFINILAVVISEAF